MDARDLSIAFAEAFCAGDLDALEALLAPELKLAGPLFRFESRSDYLRSLRDDPPAPGGCTIHQVLAKDDEAAILYAWAKPGGRPVLVAQFSHTRGGRIAETRLVFDARGM